MSVSRFNLGYMDNSKERSYFGGSVEKITSLNRDNVEAGIGAIQTAADAMTQNAPVTFSITDTNVEYVAVVPSAQDANNEMGLEFTLQDSTDPKNKSRITLPAPNLSLCPFVEAQSDVVEFPTTLTISTELQTLIDALEAEIVHPISENAMGVIRIKRVGRNL